MVWATYLSMQRVKGSGWTIYSATVVTLLAWPAVLMRTVIRLATSSRRPMHQPMIVAPGLGASKDRAGLALVTAAAGGRGALAVVPRSTLGAACGGSWEPTCQR